MASASVPVPDQATSLFHEAAFEHLLGTPIDALIKGSSIGMEAEPQM